MIITATVGGFFGGLMVNVAANAVAAASSLWLAGTIMGKEAFELGTMGLTLFGGGGVLPWES